MKISIKKSQHTDGTRLVYSGEKLIATISKEKPNKCNGRAALYGIARLTGRYDWFDTWEDVRNDALKG